MRLFIAVPLPDQTIKQLVKTQEVLRTCSTRGSLTLPQNLHATVKFLGEVYPDRLDAVYAVMEELTQFKCSTGQVKQISTLKAANIVCAKLRVESQLNMLEAYLGERLNDIGFEVERRAYVPHVTLMRKYAFTTPFAEVLDKIKVQFTPFAIEEICLFKSTLEAGIPPRYEVLKRVNLAKE